MAIVAYVLSVLCPAWCTLPSGHAPDFVDTVDGSVTTVHRAPVLADRGPHGRRIDLTQSVTVFPDGRQVTDDPLVMLDGAPDDLLDADQVRRHAAALNLAADLMTTTPPAPRSRTQPLSDPEPGRAAVDGPADRDAAPPRTAYTPRETAERLGRPYRFVLRLIETGELRARRDGQRFVVPTDAIDEYLSNAGGAR